MTPRSLTLLPALALLAAACAPYPVEGDFAGRALDGHADPERTIVLIHNHGFSLPHPPAVRARRAWELARLAERLRAQGTIFLYEGDSYYDVAEWDAFTAHLAPRAPWLQVVRVGRPQILALCDACGRDSHGAYWDRRFAEAVFEDHVPRAIDGGRGRVPARLVRARA